MVFGFANNKEIKEIKKNKDYLIYCSGGFQLSKIQYYIRNGETILDKIPTTSILTPYAFTCNNYYSIVASIDYSNGSYSMDYRLQVFRIFVLIYFVLMILLAGAFLITIFLFLCGYRMQIGNAAYAAEYNQMCRFTNRLFYLLYFSTIFAVSPIHIYYIYNFFNSIKSREYIDIVDYPVDDFSFIAWPLVFQECIMLLFELLIMFVNAPSIHCFFKALITLVTSVISILNIVFLGIDYSTGIIIFNIIVGIIPILCSFFFLKKHPITRIAVTVYFICNFIDFPLAQILYHVDQEKVSANLRVMEFALLFMVFHGLTFVLLFIAVIFLDEFAGQIEDSNMNASLYHQFSSYTFTYYDETTVYINQTEINNGTAIHANQIEGNNENINHVNEN